MDEPKRTKAEQQAHTELLIRLVEQESWMRGFLDSGSRLPAFGTGPGNAAEREIEIDLDADMVKWFRALGPVHPARINAALRAYALEMWKTAEDD